MQMVEQLQVGSQVSLKIAVAPFIRAKFLGGNFPHWKGPVTGDGWEGVEERDMSSRFVTDVDFERADFLNCFREGDTMITGEEKLARLKELGRTLYGVTVFAGLYKDYREYGRAGTAENSVLERLFTDYGVALIGFFGDVYRSPGRRRIIMGFARCGEAEWEPVLRFLDDNQLAIEFSVVSKS